MKVSIALASFNGERYIKEQLQSFLDQTRLPDEVVISDDASTDGTMEIVRRFQDSAPFEVKVIQGRGRQGFVANFNRALAATTGDLVFLSDQDDVWFSNKLEAMEATAKTEKDAWLLMCDAALVDHNLEGTGLTRIVQIANAGLPLEDHAMGCCCAIRREFLDLAMPIPANFKSHDVWFVRIADGLGRKHVSRAVLQYYRRHGNNVSDGPTSALMPLTRMGFQRMSFMQRWSSRAAWLAKARLQLRYLQMLREGVARALRKDSAIAVLELEELEGRWERVGRRLEDRVRLRCIPRRYRIPGVISIWCSGGYKSFNGWKSAASDLLLR
ncbi:MULTISPECIES: glycosyltransferase family 2 protein [unclassified Thioalkalivibrio]|uniref:glycosyltransferase family 2 protein n=1 Tax=unclassified Thioalkalivibrio TaxID=2621013 RepID=UPI00036BA391|nr:MULTISPECIES: glycosyltransferase family 2 protein [unclassified Thioalkalivibrio]